MTPQEPKDRIIIPLDVPTVGEAIQLVNSLGPHVGQFKIGLQFINTIIHSVISPVSRGDAMDNLDSIRTLFTMLFGKIFWDGKFDDIPNTVGGATTPIANLRVKMINVHASAGIPAMMEAVANRGDAIVLAVTVLTSFEENDGHLTFGAPTKAKVIQFARDAKLAGVQGIICSPKELEILKKKPELRDLITVIPGIRPTWSAINDQERVTTPTEAIKSGADYLVIGRPITKPPKEIGGPVEAAKKIADEIAAALTA